jgi:hypothetical protein
MVNEQANPDYRSAVLEIYNMHDPAKLFEVEDILAKFAGRESVLYGVLCRKYGAAPSHKYGAAPSQNEPASKMEQGLSRDESEALDYRSRVFEIYKMHAPARLPEVDGYISKFAGPVSVMYSAVCRKYGVVPIQDGPVSKMEANLPRLLASNSYEEKSTGKAKPAKETKLSRVAKRADETQSVEDSKSPEAKPAREVGPAVEETELAEDATTVPTSLILGPQLAGPLLKLSGTKVFGFKRWQLRWFQVRDGFISWYDSPSDAASGKEPKGSLELSGLELARKDGTESQFTLKRIDAVRTYELDTDCAREVAKANWEAAVGQITIYGVEDWLLIGIENKIRRPTLVQAAFARFDVHDTGLLTSDCLKPLADFIGFQGDGDDWEDEFAEVCSYLGCEPELGLDMVSFDRFVNDGTMEGCFCTDVELKCLSGAVISPPDVDELRCSVAPTMRAFLLRQNCSKWN